jgi:hypothetical protein
MKMNESELKSWFVKKIKQEGGYGRRIEDQFGVGLFDLILVPKGGPVFFVEAKIIRATTWGATDRQMIELERAQLAGGSSLVCAEMGFNERFNTITLRRIKSDHYLTRTRSRDMVVSDLLLDLAKVENGGRHEGGGGNPAAGVTSGGPGSGS